MPQVLVRGVEPQVLDGLKRRARISGRSLEAELRDVLRRAAEAADFADARTLALRLRRQLAGRRHGDSGALQAEARRR